MKIAEEKFNSVLRWHPFITGTDCEILCMCACILIFMSCSAFPPEVFLSEEN